MTLRRSFCMTWSKKNSCSAELREQKEFKSLRERQHHAEHFDRVLHGTDESMLCWDPSQDRLLWCQRRSSRMASVRFEHWQSFLLLSEPLGLCFDAWLMWSYIYFGTVLQRRRLNLLAFLPILFDGDTHHNRLLGVRIGEAKNPGPEFLEFQLTTLNPTAINEKEHILGEMNHHVFLLSENSATSWVQGHSGRQLAKLGFQSVWGHPAPLLRAQSQDVQSCYQIRGAAVGVSIHSKIPLMSSRQDLCNEWYTAGRLLRSYLKIGQIDVQLIVLYGLAKSQPGARSRTNLLLREAANLAHQTELPTIRGGDLNHSPDTLETWRALHQTGWRSSQELHQELYGVPQPMTYQQATAPDVLLFHPMTLPWLQGISVDQSGWVPGHHPLTVALKIPMTSTLTQKWRKPGSWLPYEPNPDDFAKAYIRNPCPSQILANVAEAPSIALKSWSTHVEKAISGALALQHEREPLKQPFTSLPKKCRGRCNIPKIIQTPLQKAIRRGWAGQFTPEIDIGTMKLRQWTRQVRRLQSLRFQIQKAHSNPVNHQAYALQQAQEWLAILKAPGFAPSFPRWLQQYPELPLLTMWVPNEQILYDIEQILIYETNQLAYLERKHKDTKRKFDKWFDKVQAGRKHAYSSIREPALGTLQQVEHTLAVRATSLPYDGNGLVQLNLSQTLPWRPDLSVWLDEQEATVISVDADSMEVMLIDAEQTIPRELQISQKAPTSEPTAMGRVLSEFWYKYWRRDSHDEQNDLANWGEFRSLLEELPQEPLMTVDLTDLELWREAISTLKSKSARGICGWYSDEIKYVLNSDLAFQHLVTIFSGITHFPSWLMQTNIAPVMKMEEAKTAADIRPITVYPMIYRLWSRTTSRRILKIWASSWPMSISGFLPSRHSEQLIYFLQHSLEKIHVGMSSGTLGGLTLETIVITFGSSFADSGMLVLDNQTDMSLVDATWNNCSSRSWHHRSSRRRSHGCGNHACCQQVVGGPIELWFYYS